MSLQEPSAAQKNFAANLLRLRKERNMTQEALADAAELATAHIGYFEQYRNAPTIDTAAKIAQALGVPLSELFTESANEADPELGRLNSLMPYVRRYQELANEYGIYDVFQDNGGKLLQTLVLTGLQNMPGREGNDARDNSGTEWELKTVNQHLTKSFSTHHHLTVDILAKYRTVQWLFCVYEGIEIVEIYAVGPEQLEPIFAQWETKLNEAQKTQAKGLAHKNNPKIPLSFVRQHGARYYSDAANDKLKPARKLAQFEQKFIPSPPKEKKTQRKKKA